MPRSFAACLFRLKQSSDHGKDLNMVNATRAAAADNQYLSLGALDPHLLATTTDAKVYNGLC